MIRQSKQAIQLSWHECVSCMIDECVANARKLKYDLLLIYAEICIAQRDTVLNQISENIGMVKVLVKCLQSSNYPKSPVIAAKILMQFVKTTRSASHSAGTAITGQIIHSVGDSLSALPPTTATYIGLMDVLLGKFNVSTTITDSDDRKIKSESISGKDTIVFSDVLEGLIHLMTKSTYKLKQQQLKDLLLLLKTSQHNRKMFCSQPQWERLVVSLLCLANDQDALKCNHLIAQIASSLVFGALLQDEHGANPMMGLLTAVDQRINHVVHKLETRRMNERDQALMKENKEEEEKKQEKDTNKHNKDKNLDRKEKLLSITTQCRILYQFLVEVVLLVLNQLQKSSYSIENSDQKKATNLRQLLDVTEYIVFDHRFSALCVAPLDVKQATKESDIKANMLFESKEAQIEYPRNETRNEQLLLKMLLICTLKYVSFSDDKQSVLRRAFRYWKEVLPHNRLCIVFDECVASAREIIARLQAQTDENIDTIRIAYLFVKNAYIRYTARGDNVKTQILHQIQKEIYSFWGVAILTDNYNHANIIEDAMGFEAAQGSLENESCYARSLWIFLQDQAQWEDTFQYALLGKFQFDYFQQENETKQLLNKNMNEYDLYIEQCIKEFNNMNQREQERISKVEFSRQHLTEEIAAHLENYMKYFIQDYQCRFPDNSNSENKHNDDEVWELDLTETPNHKRHLLVRNLNYNHNYSENKTNSKPITSSQSKINGNTNEFQQSNGEIKSDATNKDERGDDRDLAITTDAYLSSPSTRTVHSSTDFEIDSESKHNHNNESSTSIAVSRLNSKSGVSDSDWDLSSIVDFIDDHDNKAETRSKVHLKILAVNVSLVDQIEGTLYVTDYDVIFQGFKSQDSQQFTLHNVKFILPRRYLLRENGIEIWIMKTQKSYLFIFENEKRRNKVLGLLCKVCPRVRQQYKFRDIVEPGKIVKIRKLTQQWQLREISNFDYLMELNIVGGRSYNDITQYPVFPWIINDFSSSKIDINDKSIYRDLSKPIGALNEQRLQDFVEMYTNSQPYYYITHYMSAAVALHYLRRIEPIRTLISNLAQQGFNLILGNAVSFDSISNAWDSSLTNSHDVKEVVPEMYYFSEFLRNVNINNNNNKLNDVILPPWADNSAEKFVKIMGDALESEYVSQHIHEWIDLIFGYKQRSEEAKKSYNVFAPLSYPNDNDPDHDSEKNKTLTLTDVTDEIKNQIYQFGQCPNQLFDSPHPKRYPIEHCDICKLSLPFNFNQLQNYHPTIMCVFDRSQQPLIIQIVNSKNGRKLKLFDVQAKVVTFDLPQLTTLNFNNSPSTPTSPTNYNNTQMFISTNEHESPKLELLSKDWRHSIICAAFVMSNDGLYGITGGYLDASIKVHYLRDGQLLQSVTAIENGHNDLVTCLCLNDEQDILLSGAKDGSIVYWTSEINYKSPQHVHIQGRAPFISKPRRLLSIHFDAVGIIAINTKLGVIVSAANDATIALYSVSKKQFIRRLYLNGRGCDDTSDNDNYNYNYIGSDVNVQVLKIIISDSGYIIIHSLEKSVPYLRVLSLNGVLIKVLKINEVLSTIKIDKTANIIITGGDSGFVKFRTIFDLTIIQEIVVFENEKILKYHQDQKDSESIKASTSPKSRIIDLDLDSDNTFMIVAIFNVKIQQAQVLLYPLPNTRNVAQFDTFVFGATKALKNFRESVWDVQNKIGVSASASFIGM